MNTKIKEVLTGIVNCFQTGDIPQAIAYSLFPIPDIPSAKWSLLNRTIMFFAGTQDARGMRQWNRANRYVKKGAKALYILVPYIKKEVDEETGEEKEALKTFLAKAVFRYEDTDGEPLEYQELKIAELPLMERAKDWGISLKAIPGGYGYYGYYSNKKSEIAVATKEECVFFHELSHVAHDKIKDGLKAGQDPLQEIVAELSAQALCRLVGKQANNSLGNSYQYIERYAKAINLTPVGACLKAISEVEKVLNIILKIN